MLSPSRSSNSRSFLRELENALVLIDDERDRNYFLEKMREVFIKRNDPLTMLTGERNLKRELLSYLKERGFIQTANIWARNIPMDRDELEHLLQILQTRLVQNNIQGILELHLQDREINSPHFQFVGLECERAEGIIAHTLVELAYETSMESALSKKDFTPYYEDNPKARVWDLNDTLDYYEKLREPKILKDDELLKSFDESFLRARELLQSLKDKRAKLGKDMQGLQMRLSAYKAQLRTKNHHLKRLRRKRRR